MRGDRLFLLLAALAAPTGALYAQDQVPALYSVTGVSFDDTLNVREKPDAKSAVAAKLAPDAVDIEVTGFSRDGSWARITTGERAGWVAARFLKRQDQAPWWEGEVPLNCYGTEPFWSLQVTSDSTQFDSPLGPEEPDAIGLRATIPASDRVAALGIGMGGGFAVIRPADCNDGMSDRTMALTIDFFRSIDGEETGYSGCCTLNP